MLLRGRVLLGRDANILRNDGSIVGSFPGLVQRHRVANEIATGLLLSGQDKTGIDLQILIDRSCFTRQSLKDRE